MELTEEEKTVFLNEHFSYEVEELILCDFFLASLLKHEATLEKKNLLAGLRNTAMEHLLLHARILLEFLFYSPSWDHARASAYVADWATIRQRTDNINVLEERVNNEIAHLAWARLKVKQEEKGWLLIPIANDLLDTTALFLSKLDDRYKGPRIQALSMPLGFYKTTIIDIFGTLMRPY